MTKAAWVRNRLTENTVESLEEALGADPHNPQVAIALARALLDSSTGDRGTNLRQAAVLANQANTSPDFESLKTEITLAQTAHAFDLRVTQLEEEALAAANAGETTSLALLHQTLILANFIGQADGDFKITTDLRPPQELIDIEHQTQFLVTKDSEWRYLDNDQPPPSGWISPDFDHDSWQYGPGPLGYGDSQATTVQGKGTRAMAFYFRHRFDHQAHPDLSKPTLRIQCDDGAVVYLNGKELLRHNMPDGACLA